MQGRRQASRYVWGGENGFISLTALLLLLLLSAVVLSLAAMVMTEIKIPAA